MGVVDLALAHLTAAVLSGKKAAKIKGFVFDGHSFVQSHLAHMAIEIIHPLGALNVEYESSLNGSAEYDSKENKLFLGFVAPDSLSRRALIIHETTHALFDFKKSKMDIATSESIAYIAQCQYARANNKSTDPGVRLYSSDTNKDKVFEVGWRLAGKILEGKSLNSTDFSDMRRAVAKHPFYATKHSHDADFDGM